jgi:UDP-glucuronate 4-epimerase
MSRVLVTGAAGFIGFHLVKSLVNNGDYVIGYDNINDYYDVNLKYGRLLECGIIKERIKEGELIPSLTYNNYSFIKADLEDSILLNKIFAESDFDYVINLAAQPGVRYSLENPQAYIQSNVVGFLNILEACRHFKIQHLVYASSSSVYGMNEKIPFSTSDNVDHPVSLYAATKKSNELMAHTYSHLYNIPTTGLRFFTVYGPWGRPDMALFLFTKAILDGEAIKVFNDGQLERDFTYIDDIVNGIIPVISNPAKGEGDWSGYNPDPSKSKAPYKLYNIGNSSPVKLLDFIEAVESSIGIEAKKEFLPMQPGDVYKTWADCSGLEKDFAYDSKTDIETGVKAFVNWYKRFYEKTFVHI